MGEPFFAEADYPEAVPGTLHAYRVNTDGTMEHLGDLPRAYHNEKEIGSTEAHALELDNGTILCHIRNQSEHVFTVYQCSSIDGGRTWSEPRQILKDNSGSPPHLMKHSSGAIICSYGHREKPYGVRVMFSFDNGENWDIDHVLYDEGIASDLGYPCTIEMEDGSLLTVFYTRDANATLNKEYAPGVIMQMKWKFER